ncbi:MAG: hypothetical protein ACP5RC_09885, partial [Halothiobacillaceae bacterium]
MNFDTTFAKPKRTHPRAGLDSRRRASLIHPSAVPSCLLSHDGSCLAVPRVRGPEVLGLPIKNRRKPMNDLPRKPLTRRAL